jgi:hypothetical protein
MSRRVRRARSTDYTINFWRTILLPQTDLAAEKELSQWGSSGKDRLPNAWKTQRRRTSCVPSPKFSFAICRWRIAEMSRFEAAPQFTEYWTSIARAEQGQKLNPLNYRALVSSRTLDLATFDRLTQRQPSPMATSCREQ